MQPLETLKLKSFVWRLFFFGGGDKSQLADFHEETYHLPNSLELSLNWKECEPKLVGGGPRVCEESPLKED